MGPESGREKGPKKGTTNSSWSHFSGRSGAQFPGPEDGPETARMDSTASTAATRLKSFTADSVFPASSRHGRRAHTPWHPTHQQEMSKPCQTKTRASGREAHTQHCSHNRLKYVHGVTPRELCTFWDRTGGASIPAQFDSLQTTPSPTAHAWTQAHPNQACSLPDPAVLPTCLFLGCLSLCLMLFVRWCRWCGGCHCVHMSWRAKPVTRSKQVCRMPDFQPDEAWP